MELLFFTMALWSLHDKCIQLVRTKGYVMAELAETILQLIAERDQIDTLDVAKELNVDHQKIVGAVKSLQSLGDVSTPRILYSVRD